MIICQHCNEPFKTHQLRRRTCDECKRIQVKEQRRIRKLAERARREAAKPKPTPPPRLKPAADSYNDYHRWTAANHYELRYYDWTRRKMVTGHACDVGRGDDIGMRNRNELTEAGMV